MADFPPNLDDGELWLPSDILPDKVSSKFTPEFPSELTYMEELAQQLSAYALLEKSKADTKPPPNLTQKFEKVVPANRSGSVAPQRSGFGSGYGGGTGVHHHVYVSERGGFGVGSRPVFQFPAVKSDHTLVGGFARAGVLQRPQNQGQNRFFPFPVNGPARVGLVRESGGTGVFFPRVSVTTDHRKKQSETEQIHQVKKFAVKKQEVGLKPPPEKGVGVPQE